MVSVNKMKSRLLMLVSLSVLAGMWPASSQASAALCRVINDNSREIINVLNRNVEGEVMKLTKRKKLLIKKVNRIVNAKSKGRFCQINVDADVVLKRKVRKNAKGTVRVRGDIEISTRGGRLQACVNNSKVTKLKLSHTRKLGEKIYKKVGNKMMPKQMCFPIDLSSLS